MALARIHCMKHIFPLVILGAPLAFAADPTVVLTPLRGHLYVVEDNFYLKEMVYVGEARVAQLTLPRARVMALVRRSPLLPGMPDAFDRAPLP